MDNLEYLNVILKNKIDKIYLASYNVNTLENNFKVLVNKFISFNTSDFKDKFNGLWRLVPSHSELVLEINNVKYMYSADMFTNRTRIKILDREHLYKWKLTQIPNELFNFDNIKELIEFTYNKKYDYIGCLLSMIPVLKIKNNNLKLTNDFLRNQDKWFCSELVSFIILNSLRFELSNTVSPSNFNPYKLSIFVENKLKLSVCV